MASFNPPDIGDSLCIKATEATWIWVKPVETSSVFPPPLPLTTIQTGRGLRVCNQVTKSLLAFYKDPWILCLCVTRACEGGKGKKIKTGSDTRLYEGLIIKVRSECSIWRRGLIVLLKVDFKGRLVSELRGMGAAEDTEELRRKTQLKVVQWNTLRCPQDKNKAKSWGFMIQ